MSIYETYKTYSLHDANIDFTQDRLLIDTNSELSLLNLARKNGKAKCTYKELLKNDFILYFHNDNISRFIKRTKAIELLDNKKYKKYKDILYTLTTPEGRKINPKETKTLLVIFSIMPGSKIYDDARFPYRMLPPYFPDLPRSLVKNNYIMRVMDLNVSHGSHYINTINFPDYEDQLENAIKNVQDELKIDKKNVVFFGVSRGGAGAIYHGTKLDYKTLAVDPIVNIGGPMYANDRRILGGLRKDDLVPDINSFVDDSNEFPKYIICSENVKNYYEQTIRLNGEKINILNMRDDNINTHPQVSMNTVPEQLMILNNLLSEFSIEYPS